MDAQAAKRYADRIRENENQAAATLRMVNHVTGHHWVGVWCSLDLANTAIEKGGSLTFFDGSTKTAAEFIQGARESLEGMQAEMAALLLALENPTTGQQ